MSQRLIVMCIASIDYVISDRCQLCELLSILLRRQLCVAGRVGLGHVW